MNTQTSVKVKRALFDIEGNGFLKSITRIHVLAIRDMDTGVTHVFRHNDTENTIEDGARILQDADLLVGHNIVTYDLKVIKKLFPWFAPKGLVRDTLVLSKLAAPDIRNFDFNLFNRGLMDSDTIGSHSLKAWGIRLGKHKGDYSDVMKSKGLDPWASWNQEMEDYCIGDLDVTEALWNQAVKQQISSVCVELEHDIRDLCSEMEENGFPFDLAAAEKLASELEAQIEPLREKAKTEFGHAHFVPEKRLLIRPLFYDPDGKQKKKEESGGFYTPNPAFGEDDSRAWWGKVTLPKVNYRRGDTQYVKGQPFCKAEWREFNPTSRPQIVDIMTSKWGWVPQDFTDTGMPSVDDSVLRKLADHYPVCQALADLFFTQKIYGQIKAGKHSWIRHFNKDTGCIHGHIDTGGAVTGRCTHRNPNLGQVPSVMSGAVFLKDGTPNPNFITKDGEWHPRVFDKNGAIKKEAPLFGRDGEYGWECRSLFYVPDGWEQVGVDLMGIEFRCLAEVVAEFDNGAMIEVIVSGQDVHAYNMSLTGIKDRGLIKRVLYALLYGAGDLKLGLTAKPTASIIEAIALGKQLRATLMEGMPALRMAIDKTKQQASLGYLIGLDGRRLKVRSPHSAFNTKLQSAAGLIAKKWLVLTRKNALAAGMRCGWEMPDGELGDFVMLAFVHDEQQNAVAPELTYGFAEIAKNAAIETGQFFKLRCPINADAKIGRNWAECH